MAAPAPDFETIRVGLRVAAMLEMPLVIHGKAISVPPSLVAPVEGVEDDTQDIEHVAVPTLETARRLCFLVRSAAEEIERLGVDIGALTPPPPEPRKSTPLTALGVRSSVLQPPAPEPEVVERDGAWIVGSIFEVRSSDNGRSWHVVHLDGGLLVAWHQTQADAIRWAKQAAKDAWRPDMPRATNVPPFTHQPRE
jgi:hypothetical protein